MGEGVDRASMVASMLERMTWPRIAIMSASVLAAIALYWVFEHRESAIPSLIQSNLAATTLGLSLVLGCIGTIGAGYMAKIEAASAKLQEHMQDQIAELRKEVDELTREKHECQIDLDAMRRRLSRAEGCLRKAGLEFENTGL